MAWRFKASKYKNAAPIVPKPETCIKDICVGSYQTYGNNICASASFMAFNWEHVGSSMAVLPLDDCGRKSKTMPLLHAHGDTITDMEFSPFHDGLLLTGSQDSLVKLWHIPPEGLKESLSTPECTLSQKQRRVENVGFHPVADGLIHVAAGHELSLWDLTVQQEAFVNSEHTEVIQSSSWKKDGRLIATSCKDKKVRIIDPRAKDSVLSVANSHQNIKDSRIVWLGDQDRILTTGFDSARLRQIMLRDVRNLSSPQKTLDLDCSTGVLMPLFDPDTNMLFLCGKGDSTILYMEVTDREPYLIEGLRHSGEQTKGACLVPKRALRVMEGEVNRVLQLASSTVVPIMYQVPRKSYRDYHADLYPDTSGPLTYVNAPMWLNNVDHPVPNISLHPDAKNSTQIHRGNFQGLIKTILTMPEPKKKEAKIQNQPIIKEPPKQIIKPQTPTENKDQDKLDFVNVKDLIKGMERHKAISPTKTVNIIKETNGYHKIMDNEHINEKIIDKAVIEKTEKTDRPEKTCEVERLEKIIEKSVTDEIIEKSVTDETETADSYKKSTPADQKDQEISRTECETDSLSRSNSLVNGSQLPPKPLPRSSISEEREEHPEAPKPKPRTSTVPVVGYKPRLGPKPFSASQSSEEFSFDKVFSVPVVPGQKSDSAVSPVTNTPSTPVASTPEEITSKDKSSPASDIENHKEEYTNGKSDTSLEEEVNSSDSGYTPKTPTTVERRKLFETTDGNSQSIAGRRRAYEIRSVSLVETEVAPPPSPLRKRDSFNFKNSDKDDKRAAVPNVSTKRTSTVFGRVSKFRHLTGTPGHKSTHIENIKNVNRQVSGECNGFYANAYRCALPVSGGGGRVYVAELPVGATSVSKGGVGGLLLHRQLVQDWTWDPFRNDRLVVACDDGTVAEWIIPEGGLKESTNTPNRSFAAHNDKIYLVRFHPVASDVLTTAAHDLTVKIWDISPEEPVALHMLTGHTDQIFAMDWSPFGDMLTTLCRDGLIRVYEPHKSCEPTQAGGGTAGGRGGRIVWALNDTHIVVTGFDKVSERQIHLYDSSDLSAPVCTVGLDVSPAILQIHIDHDSGTLFLTGRGDSTIYCYEVTCEPPFLCPLSHHRSTTLHQGIAFLQKNVCAVEKVEFARALRLTNGNVEPLSFTVPRIKNNLFQDDLFPPTLVTWSPWMSAADWTSGKKITPVTVSLQPPGMIALSAVSTPPPKIKEVKEKENKIQSTPAPDIIRGTPFDIKHKQDSIMKSMSAKVQINLELEQDHMEGVDESEWDQ